MKLKGKISILINREYTTIEIEDDLASTTFVKARLTPEQLSAVLSRQARIDCELEIRGLEKIGKKHENKYFEFEIQKGLRDSKYSESLRTIAQNLLNNQDEGWIAEGYFSSQNSFFEKDGKQYARCTIRRWI
jgi:hypothetical protein